MPDSSQKGERNDDTNQSNRSTTKHEQDDVEYEEDRSEGKNNNETPSKSAEKRSSSTDDEKRQEYKSSHEIESEQKQADNESTNDDKSGAEKTNDDTEDSSDEIVVVKAGKENTGRWSTEEHEAFLKGLELYGKEWKRVASNVGTRTVMQTRTHAQKYFDRLKAAEGGGRRDIWSDNPRQSKSTRSASSPENSEAGKDKRESASKEDDAEDSSQKKRARGLSSPAKGEEEDRNYGYGTMEGRSQYHNAASNTRQHSPSPRMGHPLQPYGGMSTPIRGGHPGMMQPAYPSAHPAEAGPSQTSLFSDICTDRDILLPITSGSLKRSANREYLDLLKANCSIFHSLPTPEQMWFVRNLCNFLQVVRGRRWFYFQWAAYHPLAEPMAAVENELRLDPLKRAALQFHPFWLLGDHDPGNVHDGAPFAHRRADGSWTSCTNEEARDILRMEGPKNILLLPASIVLHGNTKGDHPMHDGNMGVDSRSSSVAGDAQLSPSKPIHRAAL